MSCCCQCLCSCPLWFVGYFGPHGLVTVFLSLVFSLHLPFCYLDFGYHTILFLYLPASVCVLRFGPSLHKTWQKLPAVIPKNCLKVKQKNQQSKEMPTTFESHLQTPYFVKPTDWNQIIVYKSSTQWLKSENSNHMMSAWNPTNCVSHSQMLIWAVKPFFFCVKQHHLVIKYLPKILSC